MNEIKATLSVAPNDYLLDEMRNRGYRLKWACKGYRGYLVQTVIRVLSIY